MQQLWVYLPNLHRLSTLGDGVIRGEEGPKELKTQSCSQRQDACN